MDDKGANTSTDGRPTRKCKPVPNKVLPKDVKRVHRKNNNLMTNNGGSSGSNSDSLNTVRPSSPPLSHSMLPSMRKKVRTSCRTSASQAVLSRIQLTLQATRRTPHSASHLVQAKSACSVKTRRTPSQHCRDARVYGRAGTAMHDTKSPPLPLPPNVLYIGWVSVG